jgi:hypothetical protein
MSVIRLPSDSSVSAQQPARTPKDYLPSSTATASPELSGKDQQSSFARAEEVVPTEEYPLNRRVIGLVFQTQEYRLALFLIDELLRQRY